MVCDARIELGDVKVKEFSEFDSTLSSKNLSKVSVSVIGRNKLLTYLNVIEDLNETQDQFKGDQFIFYITNQTYTKN